MYSGLGGTTDYVFNLIKGDKDRHFEHSIIFYGIEEVHPDTLLAAQAISATVHVIIKKKGWDRKSTKNLKGALQKLKPHAVTCHINSLILPLASMAKGNFEVLFVEHQANHLKTKREKYWSLFAQRKAHKVISLTKEYQTDLKGLVGRYYKASKNIIIESGIVLSDYQSITQKTESIKIGMISRVNDFRDHETLIQAFLKLDHSKTSLHIAGDGPLKNVLEEKFHHDRIHWHGQINQREIISFLSELDIYVHASKGETSSMSIMQAMASALPVIGSDVQGIQTVVKAADGVLVKVGDSNDLQKALSRLIESAEKRQIHGTSSKKFAEKNFSHITMFNQYLEAL